MNGGGKLQFSLAPHPEQAQQPPSAPAPVQPAAAPPPASVVGSTSAKGNAGLRVRVQWLGRGPSPADGWVQPLTLALSDPANPAHIYGTYKGTTDRNGVVFYQNLPSGTFNVHVKGAHTLQSARAAIGLASGTTTEVDMKTQVEGDVDGDNCVTIDDLSAVQAMLGSDKGTPGFDARADLTGDGAVTMADISLLRSGFDRCGDISADNEFRALSTSEGPTLAEALAPWANPSALQHNLSLSLAPTAQNVKVGDVVGVSVVASTGSQAIDGASFVVRYDPQRFVPVDSTGNPAVGAEPGYTLPAVMGNWIDAKGGAIGYSAGIVQGEPVAGRILVATLRFRALPGVGAGPALFSFASAPSSSVQLTNGAENLLEKAEDLTISVTH